MTSLNATVLKPLQNPTPTEMLFAKSYTAESERRGNQQREDIRKAIEALKAQGKW